MSDSNSKYLILGRGNVSKHLQHYFRLTGIECDVWHRGLSSGPPDLKAPYKSILFAVSESAIPLLKDSLPIETLRCPLVHFSGSLVIEGIHGFHPLMTFSGPLYDLETYQSIPFICEKDAPAFSSIFPTLRNPSYLISKNLKPLYHAWCSLSGNLSTFLWESAFKEFNSKLNLPAEVLIPYLKQSSKNIELASKRRGGGSALTGPLSRGDMPTVQAQINALADHGSPALELYKAFLKTFEHTPRGPQ
ncbi:MAG: DUF2520 domain-containing protein [Bdellovibrionales bacterium]|nr:DUF2520 domain-containing protein [Bdellovibrionales bacterium]